MMGNVKLGKLVKGKNGYEVETIVFGKKVRRKVSKLLAETLYPEALKNLRQS